MSLRIYGGTSGAISTTLPKSLWRPSGALVETFSRDRLNSNALATLSTGRLHLSGGCQVLAGTAINTVTFYAGATGAGPYEVDSLIATGATSGTFTLSFTWNANVYTTAAINWNATAANVQTAILAATRTGPVAFSTDAGAAAALCTVGPLPGTAVTITFQNNANGPVTAQSANNASLVGGTAAFTRTTSGALPSNQWACLVDQAGNVLVKSADLTTAPWGANNAQAFTLASTYTPGSDIGVYAGLVVVANTVPSMQGSNAMSATTGISTSLTPMPMAIANTGLTNPASLGATISGFGFNSSLAYATLS